MIKRGISIAVIFMAMLVLTIVPASADVVSTGVDVAGSTTTPPVVMCKWEQYTTPDLEADVDHEIPGSQFDPPMVYDGVTTIAYYAIIFDPADLEMDMVAAEVYHPDNLLTELGGFDSFKYQVHLSKIEDAALAQSIAETAYAAGLVKIADGYVWENTGEQNSVMYRFGKGTCHVYTATEDIHYCQPAGDYRVDMRAKNIGGGESEILTNYFTYNNIPCAEFDFVGVDYGTVSQCTNKWATGNTIFSLGDGYPTVRNIGNVPINVILERQDDMNFGKNSEDEWNVVYDIRMGDTGTVAVYEPAGEIDPDQHVVLEDDLWMCHSEELDFSIHVIKGWSNSDYYGEMTLGYEEAVQESQAP